MRQLRRDGVDLAYEEAGSGAPPTVLVHDLGSDHTCFAPQFRYFSRRHRVVAVDLRGHGQSEGSKGAYTVDLLADDLAWLCYELGLYRPVVLGHGLGGMVALDLAARCQNLPSGVVVVTPHAVARRAASSSSGHIPGYNRRTTAAGTSVPVLYAGGDSENTAPRGSVPPERTTIGLPGVINVLVAEFLSEWVGRAPP